MTLYLHIMHIHKDKMNLYNLYGEKKFLLV